MPDPQSDSIPSVNVSLAIAERYRKVNPARRMAVHITYQQRRPNLFVPPPILVVEPAMGESRIEKALARIDAAVARIDTARTDVLAAHAAKAEPASDAQANGSARVSELVNRHEKLREEVAETLRELDSLIEELEG